MDKDNVIITMPNCEKCNTKMKSALDTVDIKLVPYCPKCEGND